MYIRAATCLQANLQAQNTRQRLLCASLLYTGSLQLAGTCALQCTASDGPASTESARKGADIEFRTLKALACGQQQTTTACADATGQTELLTIRKLYSDQTAARHRSVHLRYALDVYCVQ
jgi:hypothetical protein